jgi:hypothetical protein
MPSLKKVTTQTLTLPKGNNFLEIEVCDDIVTVCLSVDSLCPTLKFSVEEFEELRIALGDLFLDIIQTEKCKPTRRPF